MEKSPASNSSVVTVLGKVSSVGQGFKRLGFFSCFSIRFLCPSSPPVELIGDCTPFLNVVKVAHSNEGPVNPPQL